VPKLLFLLPELLLLVQQLGFASARFFRAGALFRLGTCLLLARFFCEALLRFLRFKLVRLLAGLLFSEASDRFFRTSLSPRFLAP
jgi:hypothetical protein